MPFFNGKEQIARSVQTRSVIVARILIPINDKVTGERFAIFGIDCESVKWDPINFYETLMSNILILFLLSTLIFLRSFQKKNKSLTDVSHQKDLFEIN